MTDVKNAGVRASIVLVIRPIELLSKLVNHSAPSGPAVIPHGWLMLGEVVGPAQLRQRRQPSPKRRSDSVVLTRALLDGGSS